MDTAGEAEDDGIIKDKAYLLFWGELYKVAS